MAESIEQFTVSRDGYTFPVEEVLTGRGFITGKSGSGKSNTASVMIEELLDRNLGLLIVDTDGEYFGLKEEYDLLHVGNGPDCDLKITSNDASRLTPYALDDCVPILLDVASYGDETEDVLHEVVEELFEAEQEYRIPFLVLVEEAHEFMPQKGGSDLKELLIRVAKRGRKRGLGICGMSQRPAAVDKDFITQCNWFVWHRLTWENDTAVVGRILGSESANTVKELSTGEALVMTDWDESIDRVQFRRKRTADAGSTPTLDDLDLSPGTVVIEDSGGATESDDDGTAEEGDELDVDAAVAEATGSKAKGEVDTDDEGDGLGVDDDVDEHDGAERSASVEREPTRQSERSRHPAGGERRVPSSTDDVITIRRGGPRTAATSRRITRPAPSLERRRERRETPERFDNPVWEVGAMMVYLYDTVAWGHWYAVYATEITIERLIGRCVEWATGRQSSPGALERFAYRTLALLAVTGVYVLVVLATLQLLV